jgi:hypothetical protein
MLRRNLDVSALPLTLALQGVALALVAFFSGSAPPSDPARIGSGDLPKPDLQAMGELRIPRDLARERLPVPKFPEFPDLDEPERAPKAAPESPKAPIAAGDKLAALRVSTVALAGLVSMDSPAPIPDAPDAIGLSDLGGSSGRSWLGGDRRTRGNGGLLGPGESGDDGSGWGGTGVGGSGHGAGGSCPTPGGGRIGRPAGGSGGRVGRPGSPGGTTGGGGRPVRGGDRPAKGGGSKR